MSRKLPEGLPLEIQELAWMMLAKFLKAMPEIGIRHDAENAFHLLKALEEEESENPHHAYILQSFANWMEAEFDEIAPLDKPYTLEEVRNLKDEDGWINGYVLMDLCEVIDHDLEWFLDEISERLVGSPLLQEISYKTISVRDETLLVYVEGKTDYLLECEGEEEEE